MSGASDDAGLHDDPEFRSALVAFLDRGTRWRSTTPRRAHVPAAKPERHTVERGATDGIASSAMARSGGSATLRASAVTGRVVGGQHRATKVRLLNVRAPASRRATIAPWRDR